MYRTIKELWCLLPFTIIIIVIRKFFERCFFTPIGVWSKVNEVKMMKNMHNPVIEKVYIQYTPTSEDLTSIAKKLDVSERQMKNWWGFRSQEKPSTLDKFTENMWLGTFYSYNFVYGLCALCDEEWFWNLDMIAEVTAGKPPRDIWWYYMVSSAFYCSLTITQFWDVRRKDFWQMFVHHIATIALLTLSWLVNGYRTGCIILLLHDAAEIVLQFGKAAKLAHVSPAATAANYTVFAVTWVATRLVMYPYCVLTRISPLLYKLNEIPYHILNAMLWLVLLLNILWTKVIYRVAYKAFTSGQEPGDMRSSSSESEDEDEKAA